MNTFIPPTPGGFYYHRKHAPEDIASYAYEIVGTAFHTETEEAMVAYRPLYAPNAAADAGLDFFVRPASLFTADRFSKITDPATLEKLKEIRDRMYQ